MKEKTREYYYHGLGVIFDSSQDFGVPPETAKQMHEDAMGFLDCAVKQRGEEVLEMAKQAVRDNSSNWGPLIDDLDQAYKERFGE